VIIERVVSGIKPDAPDDKYYYSGQPPVLIASI
jgi:hypothetical protein